MFVELNHGRWIVRCPECPSASERGGPGFEDGRAFHCQDCGATGEPIWPADREQIERAVAPRPQKHRNWIPGESIHELVADNIEHGVRV